MNVLITGARGFIGRHLVRVMLSGGCRIRGTIREISLPDESENSNLVDWTAFDLSRSDNDYDRLLRNIDVVVHLAARVHQLGEETKSKDLYRIINVDGTGRLLNEAVKFGVRRFIFLSSIKVVGEGSAINGDTFEKGYSEETTPSPRDAYAESKYTAELLIKDVCGKAEIEYVILRTPLVFGPGVKGNFLSLLHAVYRNYPLPFAAVDNRRSLIYVKNLCSGILACMHHPDAANNLFHIRDYNLSIAELISRIARSMDKKPLLFPFPVAWLSTAARLINRNDIIDRLCGSLVIDDSKIRKSLSWLPEHSLEEALDKTVNWYMENM